jgi:Tfp pilus assembly protein PilX
LGDRLGNESGIALITVLFLLILMTILGLTMMVSVNSDMMINGYYGNARASYYAADSGLNISRQYLINQVTAAVNMAACTGWVTNVAGQPNCASAPLNANTVATNVIANLLSTYGSFSNGKLNTNGAVNSWPISFMIVNPGTANCSSTFTQAASSPVTTVNTYGQIDSYKFTFNYTLCSIGTSSSLQRSTVAENGSITVFIQAPPNNLNQSYSYYGAFIDNYNPCQQGALVPGIFEGPAFTNGAWGFMNSGAYTFTGSVGQSSAMADYWTGGTCTPSATTPPGFNLNFQGGPLALNQKAKALPTDSFSQKYAVLDALGCSLSGTSCTSEGDPAVAAGNPMQTYLKNINGTAYAGTGTAGVYLPYSGSAYGGVTVGTTTYGGGIYVEGNASIVLTPGTDTFGNPTQVYTINQGSTTTTVTTNTAANTTTMVSGGTTKTLTGVPVDRFTGSPIPSTIVYVDGTITGLTGPGQGQPAIQNNAMVTIAGASNIDITGDLIYTTERNSLTTADTPIASLTGPPAITTLQQLINANDANLLGVFTASGNIVLQSTYSNNNLQVDGSLAAIGGMTTDPTPGQCTSSTCGFLVNGSINTFNNYGGQAQTNIFAANLNTQNTYYDTALAGVKDFAPPFFPGTAVNDENPPNQPNVYSTQQRTSWQWIPVQ